MPPSATSGGPSASRSTKRFAIGGAYFRRPAGNRALRCRVIEVTSIGLGGSTAPRGPVAAASQGRVPQPLLMDEASVASGAIAPPHPHPGGEEFHPPPAFESSRRSRTHVWQNCTRCRAICPHLHLMGLQPARSSVGQASESTAKRGWIKRWLPTHNPEYRAGPDAAGATRYREGSTAAGATRSTAVSSETLERAGRRPALSFRIQDLRPKRRRIQQLLRSPGTDGNLSCGTGVAKWTGMPVASPCSSKKTATRAKLASPQRHSCRSRPSMPPATVTTWPVTCPDTSSDARTTTCRATSSG
jgi:hypothetical protein